MNFHIFRCLFILILCGIPDFAVASRCIVISGLERDEINAFSKAKALKDKLKKCQIVKNWKDVNPDIPAGEKLLIIQLSHGEVGGVAQTDSGDSSAESILSKIEELSSKYKVGIYSESCYSGDLMGRFLLLNEDVKKNTCLITASVLNRPAFGGHRSLVDEIFSDKKMNLVDFFRSNSTQGLISAANWEHAGFLELIKSGVLKKQALKTINDLMKLNAQKVDIHNQCAPTPLFPPKLEPHLELQMKSACAGIKPRDLASILISLNLEKSWNPSYAEKPVMIEARKDVPYSKDFNSEELFESILSPIKQIEYFSNSPKLQSSVRACKNNSLPATCIINDLLPRKCLLSSGEIRKYLTSLLLGENPEAEMTYKMKMDEDPASFLHLFSKETLNKRSRRSQADKARYKACESFVLD